MPETLYRVEGTELQTFNVVGERVTPGGTFYVTDTVQVTPGGDAFAVCIKSDQVEVSYFETISDAKDARIVELTADADNANAAISTVSAISE